MIQGIVIKAGVCQTANASIIPYIYPSRDGVGFSAATV